MESSAILLLLGWGGVVSVILFVLKGLLDQLPPLIASCRTVMDTWKRTGVDSSGLRLSQRDDEQDCTGGR
ncbi:hypothetical protein OG429_13705 [Streptomyces sp. NBC_00190]|uniref:hypothetical protein n=1 Tax=Streptomyces sp. NBC_00190 TaxID=2903634 RepID=UPI002E2937D7|nr:hypothetical protein [Streptomyces sp. NBC_00190]